MVGCLYLVWRRPDSKALVGYLLWWAACGGLPLMVGCLYVVWRRPETGGVTAAQWLHTPPTSSATIGSLFTHFTTATVVWSDLSDGYQRKGWSIQLY